MTTKQIQAVLLLLFGGGFLAPLLLIELGVSKFDAFTINPEALFVVGIGFWWFGWRKLLRNANRKELKKARG